MFGLRWAWLCEVEDEPSSMEGSLLPRVWMCCGRSGGRWFFRGWQRKKVLPRDSEEEPSSTRRKWNIFDTRGRRFFCGNPRKKLLPRVSRTLHFLLAEDGSSAAIRGRSFFHGSARMKVLPPVSAEEGSSACFCGRRFFCDKDFFPAEEPSSASTCFIEFCNFFKKVIPEPWFFSYYYLVCVI